MPYLVILSVSEVSIKLGFFVCFLWILRLRLRMTMYRAFMCACEIVIVESKANALICVIASEYLTRAWQSINLNTNLNSYELPRICTTMPCKFLQRANLS